MSFHAPKAKLVREESIFEGFQSNYLISDDHEGFVIRSESKSCSPGMQLTLSPTLLTLLKEEDLN